MGGKTQQRVAGNAKPASSGRVRDLLINQQKNTVGNIITFSALSNSQRTATQTVDNDNRPTNTQKQQTSSPTNASKDNYKLVVKRVGNRDLYTRVRFADDTGGEELQSAVPPSQVGVKKETSNLPEDTPRTSEESSQNTLNNPTTSKDELEDQKAVEDDNVSSDVSESHEPELAAEEKLDFDELLDRIEEIVLNENDKRRIDSLNTACLELIEKQIELLKYFRVLVQKFYLELSLEDWDRVLSSVDNWMNLISKAKHPLRETYQSNFCVDVFGFIHLLVSLGEKLNKNHANSTDEEVPPMMQSLINDWSNFHSSNLFQQILALYFKLVAFESNPEKAKLIIPMIESLTSIVINVDPRIVLSHNSLLDHLDSRVELDTEFEVPSNSTFLNINEKKFKGILAVYGLLRSNLRVILVAAHSILSKTLHSVCADAENSTIILDQDQIEDSLLFPPIAIMSILTSRDSMMSALLSDYRVGDISVTIEPNTDSYACTLAYLFAWDLAIKFIVGVEKEVGQSMIHSLKRLGLLQRLLDNVFMLLPPLDERDALSFKIETAGTKNTESYDQPWCIREFLKSPLETTVKRPVNEIELVALHIYFSIALHMPVTVRKWYNNNSNKRLCNLVNEYTVKHVSQVICAIEMESVQEKCQERDVKDAPKNLMIKARPSAKEVYAVYTRDEFKMELTIKMPMNYPLGPVQIDGGKRVGVTDVKWRSWLLQLTTFLSHQNGPILDGIDLWKKNIDKRFEGVEKCTICFSILHSNYQLPKKKCQTCANIFHNLCLYKWFESSGNSTCPLCRNPW